MRSADHRTEEMDLTSYIRSTGATRASPSLGVELSQSWLCNIDNISSHSQLLSKHPKQHRNIEHINRNQQAPPGYYPDDTVSAVVLTFSEAHRSSPLRDLDRNFGAHLFGAHWSRILDSNPIFKLDNPTFCIKPFEFSCLRRLRACQSACESQIYKLEFQIFVWDLDFADVKSWNISHLDHMQSDEHGAVGVQLRRHSQKRCHIRCFWQSQTESVLAEIKNLNTKFVFVRKSQTFWLDGPPVVLTFGFVIQAPTRQRPRRRAVFKLNIRFSNFEIFDARRTEGRTKIWRYQTATMSLQSQKSRCSPRPRRSPPKPRCDLKYQLRERIDQMLSRFHEMLSVKNSIAFAAQSDPNPSLNASDSMSSA